MQTTFSNAASLFSSGASTHSLRLTGPRCVFAPGGDVCSQEDRSSSCDPSARYRLSNYPPSAHPSQTTEIVNMLTNTPPGPNPEIVAPVDNAHDTALRGLRVGAMLAQSRTERGKLALEMCRLQAMVKASTGQELFPQERADAYMRFVGQCVFSAMNGGLGGDVTAEALLGHDYGVHLPPSSPWPLTCPLGSCHVGERRSPLHRRQRV